MLGNLGKRDTERFRHSCIVGQGRAGPTPQGCNVKGESPPSGFMLKQNKRINFEFNGEWKTGQIEELRSVTAPIKWSVHSISCSRSSLPGRRGGGRQMAPKVTREREGMNMAFHTESAAGVPET